MLAIDSENLTLDVAQNVLNQFIYPERALVALPEAALVRQALLLVAAQSDYQILGICADTIAQATTALNAYLTALGYETTPNVPRLEGAVYVKFNPRSDRCHVAPYDGTHRGVLVSCQSAYDGDVNETFGHLPLDLFQGEEPRPRVNSKFNAYPSYLSSQSPSTRLYQRSNTRASC